MTGDYIFNVTHQRRINKGFAGMGDRSDRSDRRFYKNGFSNGVKTEWENMRQWTIRELFKR